MAGAARVSWFAAASRGRFRIAIAAVLLVLHWAIPGAIPAIEAAPDYSEPGYSIAQYSAPPGTLPRLMTRTQGFEAESPKLKDSGEPPTEKAKAFYAAPLPVAATAHGLTVLPVTADTPPPAFTASAFEARGPPSQQA